MRRRDLALIVLAGTAIFPLRVLAQRSPTRMHRIGVLMPGTPASFSLRAKAFVDGLKEVGRIEGQTVEIEWKWANDRVNELPELSAQLIRSNVDVIVTGGTPAAQALKTSTKSIPIVVAIMADPIAAGLVETLAHPGGNLTGFSIVAPELGAKRLQLLKEIVPSISSVAVLLNVRNPQSQIELRGLRGAAASMGLRLDPIEVSASGGQDDAFAAMNSAAAQGLIVLTDPVLFSERKLTVDLAHRYRLPAVYPFQGYVEDGGLVSYGPSDVDLFRRAAGYVDRILKGAKPAELPIEQPIKFDMYVNLKAAKTIGVVLPELFLTRADKVIE